MTQLVNVYNERSYNSGYFSFGHDAYNAFFLIPDNNYPNNPLKLELIRINTNPDLPCEILGKINEPGTGEWLYSYDIVNKKQDKAVLVSLHPSAPTFSCFLEPGVSKISFVDFDSSTRPGSGASAIPGFLQVIISVVDVPI